jgi:two-component system CheB/CheR fusion protein
MANETEGSPAPVDADPGFERLLLYLKESRAFDFTGYKRASLMRRVQHEMRRVGIESFDDYYDYLQVHPEEFVALFNTILINVTSFFRDADAWQYLTTAIVPRLLRDAEDAPIRLWSAGCATGQEAYSLAMVLADHIGIDDFRDRVKVYATDVDDDALTQARQATYAERDLSGLPPGYQEKYFEQVGGRYVFHKDLRRCVIFGRNDLVQDAPISRIDLLACRNTLMYFNAETQARIVSRFGFALNPRGVLFLGKAEMLINHVGTFAPIDLKRRLFERVGGRLRDSSPTPGPRQPAAPELDAPGYPRGLYNAALIDSPMAQLILDADDRVVLLNHRSASLTGLSDRDIGRPFQDLEVSYRPLELRSHIARARESRRPVWLRDVEWMRSAEDVSFLDVHIMPLQDATARLLGVSLTFTDVTRYRQLQEELAGANRQLETAYEELQSTNEELETTNEELQSTVEELETTNEELQSTNEELETMNEELQSMNDELQSTNEQLRDRTSEIGLLNGFMESVLGSLAAGVIVVNRDLIIQVWNAEAHDLWGLREDEAVGRHLLDLDSGLPSGELKSLVREVILDGSPGDERVLSAVNRRGRPVELHVRVSPLRSVDGDVDGALLLMEAEEERAATEH